MKNDERGEESLIAAIVVVIVLVFLLHSFSCYSFKIFLHF